MNWNNPSDMLSLAMWGSLFVLSWLLVLGLLVAVVLVAVRRLAGYRLPGDRERMINWNKPSVVLAFATWGSLLALSWLLVLDRVPFDGVSAGGWIFFLLVAVVASAMTSSKRDK